MNSILAEMREVQARGRAVVSLMRGEPDFDTPAHIVDAAAAAMKAGRTRYPDNRGEKALREAIAAKLARDNGLAYDPGSEILVTTGATLGIHAALTALLDEGDEVLLPDPIYDAYQSPILLCGGRIRPVRSTIDGGRFVLHPDAIEAALTPASRVLLLNTPWNPVGTVLREDELRAIGDLVVRRNLVLISDEIYEAITYDSARHISPAVLSDELRARTVVINSLSKTYAMTGWRAGFAANKALAPAFTRWITNTESCASQISQWAAVAALTGPQGDAESMRQSFRKRRDLIVRLLNGLPGFHCAAPGGAFYAWPNVTEACRIVGAKDSEELRTRLLHEAGVAVLADIHFGARVEGEGQHIRFSYAASDAAIEEGAGRIDAFMRKARG